MLPSTVSPRKHAGLLRQVADAEAGATIHGQRGDVVAFEADLALIGADEADDHVKGGGLAGAVGTEQSDGFAAADVDRHILNDGTFLVGLADGLGGQTFLRGVDPAGIVHFFAGFGLVSPALSPVPG